MTRVDTFPDADALARAVAELVAEVAVRSVARDGRFLWCLAGGSTPRPAYERLATDDLARRIDWDRTHVFFGDERCVPPDHDDSNYRMAAEALLGQVPLPPEQVHRIAGEREPEQAARDYERMLETLLGRAADGSPRLGFDLLLLGMGSDGHTASLFPGSEDEPARWVSPRRASSGSWRVTLTPLVLDAAREVRFVVSGPGKAGALAEVLAGPRRPRELPAQRIEARGEVRWMVDRQAAQELPPAGPSRGTVPALDVEVHR